ncbi:adenylyl-sulfate kinase [Lysobacter korlensis]|uniref:Adenylyl-sulfate kinase n=1 Tax=Lysobacter korlensis TaxID=553636 RepID=A0ABV6RXV2_9GAMM
MNSSWSHADRADTGPAARSEVVLVGGRSGVGKSTAALALHSVLAERGITHAVIEGDALDLAHPAPWEHGLAERNLAAVWRTTGRSGTGG